MNIRERLQNNKYDSDLANFKTLLMNTVTRCGYTSKEDIGKLVEAELRNHPELNITGFDLQKLITFLVSSVNAFEIITDLFDNEDVDTIYVNSNSCIIAETKNGTRNLNLTIADMDNFIEDIIKNCIYDTKDEGRIINAISPTGVRFHIVMEPLVHSSAVMVVKKFYPQIANFQSLIDSGFIIDKMADYLSGAVNANKNIIIKGLPNSGKTTLINALISKIRPEKRVVVVSDFEELSLPHTNCIRCKTNKLELKELLKLLPQRVIVDGSEDHIFLNDLVKSGLGGMIISGDHLSLKLTEFPNSVVVELKKLKDGSRKIVSVTEDGQELFRFDADYVEDGKIMGKFEVLCDMPKYEITVPDDYELEELANLSEQISQQQ